MTCGIIKTFVCCYEKYVLTLKISYYLCSFYTTGIFDCPIFRIRVKTNIRFIKFIAPLILNSKIFQRFRCKLKSCRFITVIVYGSYFFSFMSRRSRWWECLKIIFIAINISVEPTLLAVSKNKNFYPTPF